MFWFFGNKKEVENLKEDTKHAFSSVKKDITAVSGWIKHLDSEKDLQKKQLEEIKEDLSTIKEEIDGLKNILAMMNDLKEKRVFKTPTQVKGKQTGIYSMQSGVQTDVQTPELANFSVTERAIVWLLLNSDMKLSYDDLAAMLGKERSTIRGQVNSIRQKGGNLIEEQIEKNGKKRVYIPEEMKEKMLKKAKVRVKKGGNVRKKGEM